MAIQSDSGITERPQEEFYVTSPNVQDQDTYLTAYSMDRSFKSGSSMDSGLSTDSYQEQNNAESPATHYDSPRSDSSLPLRYNQMSLETSAPSQNCGEREFLFDIEKHGDPRISWVLYYDFEVTKNEAYWQLQPGYLATEKYPSRIISEKTIIDGRKLHPCHYLRCKADPFTRHYDLERHFNSHRGDKNQVHCDYKKCNHTEPFRKDHGREHYRQYHAEDLVKRGTPKMKKCAAQPETVEEFLAARVHNLDLTFWRCVKCMLRVEVAQHSYTCPNCNLDCEPVRVECRKRAIAAGQPLKPLKLDDRAKGSKSTSPNIVIGCGRCENSWVPDDEVPQGWAPCPQCHPYDQ